MMEYYFFIKDSNAKAYILFFWFLFCLHLLVITIATLTFLSHLLLKGAFIIIVFYAVMVALFFTLRNRKSFSFNQFRFVTYLLHFAGWVLVTGFVAPFIFLLLISFVEKIKSRKTTVSFRHGEVVLQKPLSSVTYLWPEFSNVVLKDGLLTLDFTNNNLLQIEVDGFGKEDEKKFNQFCKDNIYISVEPMN